MRFMIKLIGLMKKIVLVSRKWVGNVSKMSRGMSLEVERVFWLCFWYFCFWLLSRNVVCEGCFESREWGGGVE